MARQVILSSFLYNGEKVETSHPSLFVVSQEIAKV